MKIMKAEYKPPTPAQRWAQKRNWHKARITDILGVCQNPILTRKESLVFNKIYSQVKDILENWDKENSKSKQQYLSM